MYQSTDAPRGTARREAILRAAIELVGEEGPDALTHRAVAERAGVAPTRISFRHALQFIRLFWLTAWTASPGVLPRRLEALHDELALLILPARRSHRRYPRAVKIKMSNYPRKRPRRRRIRVK